MITKLKNLKHQATCKHSGSRETRTGSNRQVQVHKSYRQDEQFRQNRGIQRHDGFC